MEKPVFDDLLAMLFVIAHLGFLPPLGRGLAVSGLMIVTMTYVVMPRVTRWMAFWLYPKS